VSDQHRVGKGGSSLIVVSQKVIAMLSGWMAGKEMT
jgi:hypothetical protein